ncbi:MAG: ATP-dependent zinc metalloprotease FtsH, partial [Rhabdochlamydiaceae bacterium]
MNNQTKQRSPKKGFSHNFILFVIATVLLGLTLNSFSEDKGAKVAFSYQIEHLVNLDLLDSEESQKVSLNDNLSTFSGRFKSQLSDESKARFKFLELLNQQNELKEEKQDLGEEIDDLRASVQSSAEFFLKLTGFNHQNAFYDVVSLPFNSYNQKNNIAIDYPLADANMTLKDLDLQFQKLQLNIHDPSIPVFGKDFLNLVKGFRSSTLGIGVESVKQELKSIEEDLSLKIGPQSSLTPKESVDLYAAHFKKVKSIALDLDQQVEGIRLNGLRSVRNYKMDLDSYQKVSEQLDINSIQLEKAREAVSQVIWFFKNQELSTRSLEKQNPEIFAHWFAEAKQEWSQFSQNRGEAFKAPDQPRTLALDKTFKSQEPSPNYFSYFLTILPVLLVISVLYFIFSKQMKGAGSGALSFGKSPAKLLSKDKNKITFKDVAGCDEAKEELKEIVDFLKDPAKFTSLGARIPKGVLCIGAPGTGKTLIAKAVAGEADRPFFSISGSDFVEMFVGVGASRIRDMFDQAKKNAPCIIFMDEIDAVGRHRGAGIGGGHDEREQTLNQLLVEMDGVDTGEGVILIAATNRPDVLDKALLRPGRFDRRIVIDLPDVKGRYDILKVHAKKIKMDASVDLMDIARNTPGSSGADLANILNEAALLAARRGRLAVTAQDASEACDKVRYGKERKSLEIDRSEKLTTAYHESGHAIVALCVKHSDTVDKVTIIPRGMSLGATHFMPKKNRLSYWKEEIVDQLAILMGGRVAEEIFVKDISSGAQMDISQATRLARSMVCEWGMNESLGLVAYDERSESGQYLGTQGYKDKNYSESTAKLIDEEVKKLLDQAHLRAIDLLTSQKEKAQLMTDMLMEFESLDRQDVLEIIDGSWNIETKKDRL